MTETPLRILIVSYTPTAREPRVLKQIAEFTHSHEVTTAGYGPAPKSVSQHIELNPLPRRSLLARVPGIFSLLLLLRWYRLYIYLEPRDNAAFKVLSGGKWDVIVAHDAQTLSLAHRIGARYGVLADMHEYAPRQGLESLKWKWLEGPYFTWLCKTYLPRATAVSTVSSGIVDAYRDNFGVDPQLVINATPYYELPVRTPSRPLRLVHSGGIAPQRRLDTMIEGVMRSSADVTLDMYLLDDSYGILEDLRSLAAGDSRIRFREPVPYNQLVSTLNEYDVGLSIFPPTTFNLQWCLPNKLFDYLQARLGVIVGPSPEMVRFVKEHEFGLILPDFSADSLAKALDGLTLEEVAGFKHASARSATVLSGEEQSKVWGRVVDDMAAR